MIEFMEYRRDPQAPERLVSRVGGIYRLGSIIKCTFVLETPGPNGTVEAIERASLLWEPSSVYAANHDFEWAFREISKGTYITADDGGGRRAKHQ